jgi:hypothetical protein
LGRGGDLHWILEKDAAMSESPLMLTDEERRFLREFLENAQKEARIEEHRTRTLSYREQVIHRENVINGLLNKLGTPSVWEEVGI